jgi:hypothetical protein
MNRCVVPLPIEHTHAPRLTVRRSTALLALACAFAAGATLTIYLLGFALTQA